ncbi:hypothetical protein ACH5RR_038050 [Cinchona calisaya]|uniref:Cytochrome P450 n=1 Tax=Cinchona calisaya TaxID=153742 RepID=A0ABD2Y7Z9_9GENT
MHAVKETMKLASGFNIADIYPSIKFIHLISGVKPKLERLHTEVDKMLEEIINDHRIGSNTNVSDEPEGHKDLVDVLLKYHEDENLDFLPTVGNAKAVLLVNDLYLVLLFCEPDSYM